MYTPEVVQVLDGEQVKRVRHNHERADGTGYPDGLREPAHTEGALAMALAEA